MADYKPVVNNAGKHEPIPVGSKLSVDTLAISAKPYQAITVQDDGIHVSNAPDVRVTRRKMPEGFDLQIERTPATGMQVVRVTGTTSNTTSVSYDIDWSTHPFANTAYLFAGAHSNTGTLLQSPPVSHTTTGARINVRQPGPFIVEFRGYY